MIDKDRDYDLIIKIIEICFVEKQLHASQKISILDWIWIFRKKKKMIFETIYFWGRILKKNSPGIAEHVARSGLSLSLSSLQMRRYRSSITEAVYVHRTRPVGYIATSIFNQRRRATDKICIRLYIGTNLKSKYILYLCLCMGLGTERDSDILAKR